MNAHEKEHIQKLELHVNMQGIHKVKAINVISRELKLPTRKDEKYKRLAGAAFFLLQSHRLLAPLLLSISNTKTDMERMLTLG